MKTLSVPIPDGLPEALELSESEFSREAVLLFAVKLFELGRVSAGMAAQIAGMARLEFLETLSRYQVPAINLDREEARREIEAADKLSPP